jgi:hypothetical protein
MHGFPTPTDELIARARHERERARCLRTAVTQAYAEALVTLWRFRSLRGNPPTAPSASPGATAATAAAERAKRNRETILRSQPPRRALAPRRGRRPGANTE